VDVEEPTCFTSTQEGLLSDSVNVRYPESPIDDDVSRESEGVEV